MGLFQNEKQNLEQLLNVNEISIIKKICEKKESLINHEKLLAKLICFYSYGVFAGEMPYSVQKAQSQTPDEWLENRLHQLY